MLKRTKGKLVIEEWQGNPRIAVTKPHVNDGNIICEFFGPEKWENAAYILAAMAVFEDKCLSGNR